MRLNFTQFALAALEETGNTHYRFLPFGDVPESVFIDAYMSANEAINNAYVSEVSAKDCWDAVGTNFFMGKQLSFLSNTDGVHSHFDFVKR